MRQDPDNAAAWMWMATTATDTANKQRYLQRVLELDPDNTTARAALRRLGGTPPPKPNDTDGNLRRNVITFVGAVVLIIGTLVVAGAIYNAATRNAPPPTDADQIAAFGTRSAQQTQAAPTATLEVSLTPSVTPTFAGNIVTLAPATLPATFTPTEPPPPTQTATPTVTPIPLDQYTLYYSGFGPDDVAPQLYRISANGTDDTRLDVQAESVSVSPDGEQIAFLRPSADEDATPGTLEIFVAPVDAPEDAEQLTTFDTGNLSAPVWSPDGRALLYVRDQTELESLQVANPNSTTTYLSGEDTGTKTFPAWSPDGDRLLFATDFETPGQPEIYAYDIESEMIQRLTNDAGSSFAPVYAPDGEQIAFISDRNGDNDLYVMAADGSSPLLLTVDDSGATDRDPAWSPDGRWIAFSSDRTGSAQLYLTDPAGLERVQVTANDRRNLSPSFLP